MTATNESEPGSLASQPSAGLILVGGVLWTAAWMAGALLTQGDHDQALVLAAAQGTLGFLTLLTLRLTLPRASGRAGAYVLPVLIFHISIYYGVFNIVPALLVDLRPSPLLFPAGLRVPAAPISAYLIATFSAASFLLGVTLGSLLVRRLVEKRFPPLEDSPLVKFAWLPRYRTAVTVAVVLQVVILIATLRYGTQYYVIFANPERELANVSIWERLVFYGVVPFLSIPPLLAAAAILVARTRSERRWATVMLVVLLMVGLAVLSVWGMRSAAIFVFLLPAGLLVYSGQLRWQVILVPSFVLGLLVYLVVTIARIASLGEGLGQEGGLSLANAGALLRAGADQEAVVERFASDLSYRTSGLEPVASIIEGQRTGALAPMYGRALVGGFVQALPAPLRPPGDAPDRIKTAPSERGWFQAGDWVTTVLSELVMDFGPWLIVFPAILVGVVLTLCDQALLILGQSPALQPLLVLRLAWLLAVLNAGSLGELTLMFVKATLAYALLLIVIGGALGIGIWFLRAFPRPYVGRTRHVGA